MYIVKITDDNDIITKPEKIMEKSNAVDKIQILVRKKYKGQLDITDCTAYMKYILPISHKIKNKLQLIPSEYEDDPDFIQYLVPVEANDLTFEPGDVEISFTFIKLGQNEDDSFTSYIRKTESGVIHITPLASFDAYEPSEYFDEFDQRILAMENLSKKMAATTDAIYNGMVQDIHINEEERKIVLQGRDGNDTGKGIEVNNLSTYVAEDLVGKDPDGTQDGVTNIDNVPGIANLDDLLK